MSKHYKIVHCGIFNEKENGNFFYGLERKISHGLIQNGHFVYDFSYRDIERNSRFLGIKDSGLKKMNQKLIDICKNINVDILLLSKAEKVSIETLIFIKKLLPNIKIVQWYADLRDLNNTDYKTLNICDTFFTTNGTILKELSKNFVDLNISYLPNISDVAFDKTYYDINKDYDIIYIGGDYSDNRKLFARLLKEFCEKENIKYKIYASLGEPRIFGDEFHRVLSKTKIGITFNADDIVEHSNKDKLLYTSDRTAQFLGCGICTFSPFINGLEDLYKNDEEIVYFENVNDCFEKIKYYLTDDRYKKIAYNGQVKSYNIVNSKRVTNYMLEYIFQDEFSENYEWSKYKFKKGNNV